MPTDASTELSHKPTQVRYQILAAATAASVILYFHRAVLGELFKFDSFTSELGLDANTDVGRTRQAWIKSAFFWPYALCQVPSGWFADRFGRRVMLALYIVVWSVSTMFCGFVAGFASLLVARIVLGIAQAGAYPTCGGLLSRWMPPSQRALGSAVVSSGGRFGGIINPYLTSLLIATLALPWRGVLATYGLIGVAIGVWFWVVSRDEPAEHPRVNEAERELIAEGRPPVDPSAPVAKVKAPIREMLTSPVMWCMCVMQFFTNIGWTFVINEMPDYLTRIKGGDQAWTGALGSMVWACGFVGMLLGGKITDVTTRWWGLRWGRMIPTIVTRFFAAALFLAALESGSPLEAAIVFGAIAFFCDLGIPAIWAFAQDVGGRSVGAVLGWGNMFGNLGGAVASHVYLFSDNVFDTHADRSGMLYAAMLGFVISGLACFGINPAKPIVPEDRETAAS